MKNLKSRGLTIWFTGLSGSGKSTIGKVVYDELVKRGSKVEMLDGDVVRTNLCKGLGFSKEDRDTNIRRIGFVAGLLTKHDVIAIVAAISPYANVRQEVRQNIGNFMEIYCETDLAVLEQRDVKGLYRKARLGEIANFTGISDPYEPPTEPEVHLHTESGSVAEEAAVVLRTAELLGFLKPHELPAKVEDRTIINHLRLLGR